MARRARLGATAITVLVLAGCGGGSGTGSATSAASAASAAPAVEAASSVPVDTAAFSDPLRIDNTWFPMTPGTQLVLEGEANRGRGELAHRVVITVTDLSKVVHGVRARVVWERDVNEGTLRETELAFFAQDDAGNLWNLGEYPEENENGQFSGAPNAWLAGQANARAGLLMRADPKVGTESYVQGYSPDIEFLDEAMVSKTGERVCLPASCYDDVVVVDEWSPLDPTSGHQLKYYAKGIGSVQVAPVGGDARETLNLTSITQISPEALAQARDAVIALDRHAYDVAPDIWADTPRATVPGVPTTL